jgi:glutathione S-transferase
LFGKYIPDILTPFPHVKAWFDTLVALPASQAVIKEQQDAIAAFQQAANKQ